jgi:hypothetical protein
MEIEHLVRRLLPIVNFQQLHCEIQLDLEFSVSYSLIIIIHQSIETILFVVLFVVPIQSIKKEPPTERGKQQLVVHLDPIFPIHP